MLDMDAQKVPKEKRPTSLLDLCFPSQNQMNRCYESVLGKTLGLAHQGQSFCVPSEKQQQ